MNIVEENEIPLLEKKILTIDDILINLKIISRIRKGDKLYFNLDDILEIDNRLYFRSLRRWLSNDSRIRTIKYINKIIDKSFEIINKTYINEINKKNNKINSNKKSIEPFKEENSNLLQRLSLSMTNSIDGLQNMSYTYKNDSLFQSQIDILIEKIKIRIDKINKILKIDISKK